jgi:hypothetical protein
MTPLQAAAPYLYIQPLTEVEGGGTSCQSMNVENPTRVQETYRLE